MLLALPALFTIVAFAFGAYLTGIVCLVALLTAVWIIPAFGKILLVLQIGFVIGMLVVPWQQQREDLLRVAANNQELAETADKLALQKELRELEFRIYAREKSPWALYVPSYRNYFGRDNPSGHK